MNQTTTLRQERQEFIQRIRKADAVTCRTVMVTLDAMIAGYDDRTALEMGNAVLIAAGRKPLSVDDILAKIGEVQDG